MGPENVGTAILSIIEAEICFEHFVFEYGYMYITGLAAAILKLLLSLTLGSI